MRHPNRARVDIASAATTQSPPAPGTRVRRRPPGAAGLRGFLGGGRPLVDSGPISPPPGHLHPQPQCVCPGQRREVSPAPRSHPAPGQARGLCGRKMFRLGWQWNGKVWSSHRESQPDGRSLERVRTGQQGRAFISFLIIEISPYCPLLPAPPGPGTLARLGIPASGDFLGPPARDVLLGVGAPRPEENLRPTSGHHQVAARAQVRASGPNCRKNPKPPGSGPHPRGQWEGSGLRGEPV